MNVMHSILPCSLIEISGDVQNFILRQIVERNFRILLAIIHFYIRKFQKSNIAFQKLR